ncbi:hypothetical protein EIN_123130, partial [Entamoeba invadens IP1]
NIQNLSRWTNNNPVLIIEPGVDKTAIWKGLLQPKVKKFTNSSNLIWVP